MRIWAVVAVLMALCVAPVDARVYDYPAAPRPAQDQSATAAADRQVVVYSTTDIAAAEPLIKAFQQVHPDIGVVYDELISVEMYDRFLAEYAGGRPSANLLLSSAMDLQMKLVNDGYARGYDSAAARHLPRWAVWRNEAFGFTFEPVVIAYNRDLVPPEDVPHSRFALMRLLTAKPDVYYGRIATYDPERSGSGFLLISQDAKMSPDIWDLVRAFGTTGVKLYSTTGTILERIAAGKFLIGYNLVGSYAFAAQQRNDAVAIVLPRDYTLVMTRIAVLPKSSPHQQEAEMFLDFLLSADGQRVVANASNLYSIHPDVTGATTAAALRDRAGDSLKPIQVGPGLLVNLDQAKRQKFLKQWQRALGGR